MYNVLVNEMAAYSHVPGRNPLILNTWLREPTTHDVASPFDEGVSGSGVEPWSKSYLRTLIQFSQSISSAVKALPGTR